MSCVGGFYTILSGGRGNPLQLAHLRQIGIIIEILLEAERLILDSPLSFADKAEDLLADDLWLGCFESVGI